MPTKSRFKDILIDDFFLYLGVKYRKVIQTQDILGTYNAIRLSAPIGRKVVWLSENAVVRRLK